MKNQSEKIVLIMGEISRDSVGYPPEVNTVFEHEKWNRRNDGQSSGIQTDFNNEKQKECWCKSPEIV